MDSILYSRASRDCCSNYSFCTSLIGHLVLLAPSKIREAYTDHRSFHLIGIGGEIFLIVEDTRLGLQKSNLRI